MKPLRTALSNWEPTAALSADPLFYVRAAWSAIAGDEVAANSRPQEIAHGALLVITRSSAWSQQLSFLSERILASVRDQTGVELERVRFRVGRLQQSTFSVAVPRSKRRVRVDKREPVDSLEAALERFREDVEAFRRAKTVAGWKQCMRCGARSIPESGPLCVPCANAKSQERDAAVARLLFEAPWLGYAGIAPLVEELTPREYQAIRQRLLRRWHDGLERVRRAGGKALTARDRLIASSYVLLKSELDPERIVPAVVRDLLGDELHEIFYGK